MTKEALKRKVAMRGQSGFTLIELLVVIAILAILAGVVVFAVGNSTQNAKVAACKTERSAIITAIEAANVANEVNTTPESWSAYLDTSAGPLTYFATPSGTPPTAARVTTGPAGAVTTTECAAIT